MYIYNSYSLVSKLSVIHVRDNLVDLKGREKERKENKKIEK